MASTDKKNVISSLIESGKAKGKLSTKDITDALEELDYDVEQVDKLYSMLEGQNIEIVEEGASLEEVARVAEKVIANTRTMGMSLTACTVPAAGKPGFEIADDEVEIGMGIHGEPGTHREKLRTADEIADTLLEKILADIDYQGHEVALMINGCGGTPLMELYIVNNHVHDVLESKGIHIYKTFVGNYMTSLEMAGFAISILRLDDETKALLDAPANTPAFKM